MHDTKATVFARALAHRPRRFRTFGADRRKNAGYSVLEVTFAAALMFVIVVAIVPLFLRALESNAKGGFSSVMSNFVSADVEAVNQTALDHPDWNLPPVGVLDLGAEYWSTSPGGELGNGSWGDDPTGPGQALWVRRMKIRKYSFADISRGTISTDGTALHTIGHPQLFDSPLLDDNDGDGFKAHLVELRVTIQPCRDCDSDTPDEYSALGQRMTVSHFRAF